MNEVLSISLSLPMPRHTVLIAYRKANYLLTILSILPRSVDIIALHNIKQITIDKWKIIKIPSRIP